MTLHDIARLLKDAGKKFWNDNGPRLSAALAFYLVLSLSPLVLTVVGIVGAIYGEDAARGEIVHQIRGTVGTQAATAIEQVLAHTTIENHGVWSAIIALFTLAIGASGLFSSLQSTINAIWSSPAKAHSSGMLHAIRERLLALALVGGSAILLLLSLVISSVLTGVNDRVAGWLPHSAWIAEIINFFVSLALAATLFAMIFKWLPDAALDWSDVWLGAVITAVLMILGRYPISFYLHEVSVGSAFGAAETFVVFMVWAYYSSQILLFGAELTYVYAAHHGQSIRNVEPPPSGLLPASH